MGSATHPPPSDTLTAMTRWNGASLTSRIVLINGALFALGTLLLALSPATVSADPLASELVVLLGGLVVIVVANTLLVRAALLPLERLAGDLDHARSTDPIDRVPVPAGGLAHHLSLSINHLLGRIEAAQRGSAAAALAAQEAERSRIAQELHDGVGQSLTVVLLELGVLHDEGVPPGSPALSRARESVRASLDEVRAVARNLRPHVLADLGLRSALSALTSDLFPTGSTHVRRGVTPGLPELAEETELVVFRVAQEALTNVARHAAASTVEVTLSPQGGDVVLTVADDGRGIPAGADGTGLRGMRERASLVGGHLEVRRRDGGGTVVTLRVPAVRA
jgi:two-component system, NarL family, sensor histidine kinase UhpB